MFTLILRSNVTEFQSDLLLQKINVAETENGLVKIYWDLTGMKQEDPRLIEFIKNNVLIKPDFSVPLNLSKHTKCCKKLGGQFGQAFEAEDMLGKVSILGVESHCKFLPHEIPRELGIAGSLKGKPALSMEKGCKNHKETLSMLRINPVIFTGCGETP